MHENRVEMMGTPWQVEALWRKIAELEAENRFSGKPYPDGMAPFPGRLTGQGFFPGGDGLWREDSRINLHSTSPFPVGGIMFLGNDFGTLDTFKKTLIRGSENVPTWRHLKERLTLAEIPGDLGFYTNAVLGLRTGKKAIDKSDWSRQPDFCKLCGEFLKFQLELMQPRLLVMLGANAYETVRATLSAEIPGVMHAAEAIKTVNWRRLKFVVLLTSHPYSDFAKDDIAKAEDTRRFKSAWTLPL